MTEPSGRSPASWVNRSVEGQPIRAALGIPVAIASILVMIGLALPVFLNPVWVGFEQGRSNVTGWTGWTNERVTDVTNAILHDLVVGPPDFAMTVDGQPVLDASERGHMLDTRKVFFDFGVLALLGAGILVAMRFLSGGAAWFWRAVLAGAVVLGVSIVGLGVFFGLAFDTAFDLFHRLFFAEGSYAFDPGSERIVQLLPDQFWFETSMAVGVVLFVMAVVVGWAARGRMRRAVAGPSAGAGPG